MKNAVPPGVADVGQAPAAAEVAPTSATDARAPLPAGAEVTPTLVGAPSLPHLSALAAAVGGPLLALDTSGEVASLALALPPGPGLRLRERNLLARALPSEAVMAALVALLAEAEVAPTALRALVAGLGPGSFTGLRVGLATLKGLAFGTGAALVGGSSLAMLAAAQAPMGGDVVIVRDARRDDVYVGGYRVGHKGVLEAFLPDVRLPVAQARAKVEAQHATLSAPEPLQWGGEGVGLLQVAPPPTVAAAAPRAAYLLVQAEARLRRGESDPLAALAPAYLREFTVVG